MFPFLAIPAVQATLAGLGAVGAEESFRHILGGSRPSQIDIAQQEMRLADKASARDFMRREGFKQRYFEASSNLSNELNKQDRMSFLSDPENYDSFIEQHKSLLGALAVQTPPSPLEIAAAYSRLIARS